MTHEVDARSADRLKAAAERVAAFTAMKAGLDAQIASAKAEMLELTRGLDSAKVSTPYGGVNVATKEEHVEFIHDRWLAYVQENFPAEVVTTYSVNPAFTKAMLSRLTSVGTTVVDKVTGTVVDFAYLTDRGEPYVAYPASREQREAKEYATMYFEDRASDLTHGLREVAAIPGVEA